MRPDAIIKTLEDAGFEARYVGGCVRDTLLDRPIHDWDIASQALPEDVLRLFPHCVPTGIRHGTVTVLLDGVSAEVTTYRLDGAYHDGRHPDGVRFVRSLAEDLARRDFTINAMAMDANRCGIPVVYGFCRGVGSVSYAAAVLLLGFVLERHAPTLLLPVFAALTACGLLAMAGFRLPERPDEAADRPAERRSIAAVLRSHPRFAFTLLGCMFLFLTHTISNTYMNALVGKAGGTASAVGTSLAISAVLELPAMTLVSRLQKRFSPGFFLRFAAGAEVVKFLIFYLARSMPLIYLGHCMQFFQFAVYAPATVYYVAAALPERDQLKGQSLIYVAGSGLGGALGNLLGGRLLDRSGIQAALLLGTVSAAASLLTFCLSTRKDSR